MDKHGSQAKNGKEEGIPLQNEEENQELKKNPDKKKMISLATIGRCLCDNRCTLLIVAIVVLSNVVTGFAAYYLKTTEKCNYHENNTDPQSAEHTYNKMPIAEAICQLPWPEVGRSCNVKDLGEIKCLLPYKGEFLMNTNIYNNGNITRIWHCQGTDSNGHKYMYYKLVCNDHVIGGCISACNRNCQTFELSRKEPRIVVIVVDGSCLENGGQIEIWESNIHGKRKRNANISNRN